MLLHWTLCFQITRVCSSPLCPASPGGTQTPLVVPVWTSQPFSSPRRVPTSADVLGPPPHTHPTLILIPSDEQTLVCSDSSWTSSCPSTSPGTPYITQDFLNFTVYPRLTRILPSCIRFKTAKSVGFYHHTWLSKICIYLLTYLFYSLTVSHIFIYIYIYIWWTLVIFTPLLSVISISAKTLLSSKFPSNPLLYLSMYVWPIMLIRAACVSGSGELFPGAWKTSPWLCHWRKCPFP